MAKQGNRRKHVLAGEMVEMLEARRMFAVTVAKSLPAVKAVAGDSTKTINLSRIFTSDSTNGAVVRITTELNGAQGVVDVELYSKTLTTTNVSQGTTNVSTRSAALDTALNFLKYVDSGRYAGTVLHAGQNFAGISGADDSTKAATTLFGGIYNSTLSTGRLSVMDTFSPVEGEYAADRQPIANTIATIRDPLTGEATGGFFFNTADNSQVFTGDRRQTVFGRIIGGSSVLTTYSGLTRISDSVFIDGVGERTLDNIPLSNAANGITAANIVTIKSATRIENPNKVFSYTASSSNTQAVSASATTTGDLVLTYGSGGTATITVTGTDLTGARTNTTFTVTVSPAKAKVIFAGQQVVDGQLAAVSLGSLFTGQVAVRELVIRNEGAGVMSFGNAMLPSGFTLAEPLPATLAPGKRAIVRIAVDTSTAGERAGRMSIVTNGVVDGSLDLNLDATVGSTVVLTDSARNLRYVDSDGTTAEYAFRGPGQAVMTFAGSGLSATISGTTTVITGSAVGVSEIELSDTSSRSTFSAKTKGGDGVVTTQQLSSTAPIKSITLPGVSFTGGSISLVSGTGSVALGAVTQTTVTVTGSVAKISAASFNNSLLLVGATLGEQVSLDGTSRIGSFAVTSKRTDAFGASKIYASLASTFSLGTLSAMAGLDSEIRTTKLDRLTLRGPTGPFSLRKVETRKEEITQLLADVGVMGGRLTVSIS